MNVTGFSIVCALLLGNLVATSLPRVEQVEVVGKTKVQVVNAPKERSHMETRRRAQEWEVASEFIKDGDNTTMKKAGNLGWEVVACRRAHDGGTPKKWGSECLFKRPKLGLATKEVKVKKVSVAK